MNPNCSSKIDLPITPLSRFAWTCHMFATTQINTVSVKSNEMTNLVYQIQFKRPVQICFMKLEKSEGQKCNFEFFFYNVAMKMLSPQ